MLDFNNYIEESYLISNNAPLYHLTSIQPLKEIIKLDTLNVGYYENPLNNKQIQFVSLTRKIDLDLSKHRKANIRLEFNTNLLKQNYKIIPYDYFIHSKQEDKQKWNIERIKPFEYEEIIIKDITDLHKYLVSINFEEDNDIYSDFRNLLEYITKYNIIIKLKNKEITL